MFREEQEITATELKQNFGKYLTLLDQNVFYITKNGKRIAKLDNLQHEHKLAIEKLLDDRPPRDPIFTKSAAAEFYHTTEDQLTPEQLSRYYDMVYDRIRFEEQVVKRHYGMHDITEWEKATGEKYEYPA